jgi:hypothetical protein
MASDDYNPDSVNATLSRIIQRLDEQNVVLTRIEAQVTKTNGRVTLLETWRDVVTARSALISTAVSSVIGAAAWYFTKGNK